MVDNNSFILRPIDRTDSLKGDVRTVSVVPQLSGDIDLKIAINSLIRPIFRSKIIADRYSLNLLILTERITVRSRIKSMINGFQQQ